MNGKAWRVVAVSLLTGLTIGLPGVGQAASDEDEAAVAAMFEDGPARPDRLFHVPTIRHSYRVAVASFSFDFAEPAAR